MENQLKAIPKQCKDKSVKKCVSYKIYGCYEIPYRYIILVKLSMTFIVIYKFVAHGAQAIPKQAAALR